MNYLPKIRIRAGVETVCGLSLVIYEQLTLLAGAASGLVQEGISVTAISVATKTISRT
jgi:hypothetical protein